ncbi:MAG: LOG family protein [Acidimicrobiia bacterium]|nr:LOG family protein [Acidimicrobiia bacterium]
MNLEDLTIVAVFGASSVRPGDPEYAMGVEAGEQLARRGIAVVTGGYGGIMEAVCRGASEAGGTTVGVTAPSVFPGRSGANSWVQHEIPADDLMHRLELLTSLAVAFVALPGSLGTFTELVLAWNLALVAPFSSSASPPVIAVGEPWVRVVPELAAALDTDGELVTVVDTVDEAVAAVVARVGA